MKTHRILLPLLILGIVFSSCEKYLDVKSENTQAFIETAEDCQLVLDNYAAMNVGYPSDGEASADDYYLRESTYSGSATDLENKALYTWEPAAQRESSTPQWINPYKVVFNANLVLEALEKLKGGSTSQATLDALRGSALFFRSYAFWTLAQQYANAYLPATAGQDAGIPLRLSPDFNDQYGRGTVQQTYDRITQDLQEAAGLLPPASLVSARPNKAAAYAMLARTYLSMEDYPKALTNAESALATLPADHLLDFNNLLDMDPPFLRFNKEVIFHSVMVGQPLINPNTFGARIVPELVDAYADNDLRKDLFLAPNTGSAHVGTFRFRGNYDETTTSALFNGLAADEMYLIKAECYARANNIPAAMTALNTLLVTRWATGTYVNMTAGSVDEALTKILAERRKELLMRGLRWTDLRRLNRDNRFKVNIERKLARADKTLYIVSTLPANDLRYTLLIPRQVIRNTGAEQNPR
ncbi:RagB/SusD family nutrient uptake outer membrane protein [Pedobacter hiemivivus]|uniref:RagB/SusD family nutrient uptake outer membrane protein n=1 Tax=Pedobacter hiemivivus TaxID=2530454 RepID=A0A4R0NG59_9SPHI|nr:RagB/SusD family nutrient uptake outer membrane protein [Pedobacter hiemivivus]TCC99510.1 RagB/SusD family nutrient uptake outer membrane protein [Pedobacter hiemivivus]